MAKLVIFLTVQILLLAIVSSTTGDDGENFARTVDRKVLGLHRKEKLTHFKVYWHDILSGPNASSIMIQPPVTNSTYFGGINMIDNALTAKVTMNSTLVGQAQGFYAGAAQKELGYLMVMNFAFKTGKYNGSTITILGRNMAVSEVREMPIVGGSEIFRFARGYVEARTKWVDLKTLAATIEYSCYVLHY